MATLPHADRFQDLIVYQKARELALEIYQISTGFPKDEMFSLTDQLRRSSRSVGAQIAESWAKRRYSRHFISKLTDADGEAHETQHWLDTAVDCGYLPQDECERLKTEYQAIGRMLNGMIAKSDKFCHP
jgi:four helix bundle protein